MRLSEIRLSFEKEITKVLRDKRALLITLALPCLLFPIFELAFASMANGVAEKSMARVTRVCFRDQQSDSQKQDDDKSSRNFLAEFKREFQSSKRIRLIVSDGKMSAAEMILKGLTDVVLTVSPTFSQEVAACRTSQVDLYDNAYSSYMTDEQNVWESLRKFGDKMRTERLAVFKIPRDKTKNIEVSVKSVESTTSRSAYWTALVYSLMLVFVMSLSSMYPALDVITGERERGTLILLLLAPGDRRSYVCGKLLTVSSVTLLAAVLTLISVTLSIPLFILTTQDFAGSFRLSLPIANLFWSSILLVPIAIGISALSILISSYARTFQQGQSYFAPLILFGVALCALVICCEESAPFFVNLVPIANLMLCMFRAIQGHWDLAAIAATMLSSAVYLALLVSVAVGILDREESLFGIKQAPAQKSSFGKEAFVLFAGCLAAFFYIMPVLQATIPIWGLMLAQAFTIGLPALAVPKYLKMPLARTLSLVRPSFWSVAGALMLAPALSLLSTGIANMQSSIMPDSESYIKALQDYLMPKGSSAWTAYITIAIGPAVCEELLFRGALQGMLRKSFGTPLLCSLVAVMFGIMHGSSYRFLPTAIMGFILALLTEYTGSLFPAILLHASNNALAVFESGKEMEISPAVICVAVALAVAGVLFLRQGRKLRT